jgi:hypothetical protein
MPFKSEAQRKFMFMKHPKIADRWAKEYPAQKDLPEHVKEMHKIMKGKKKK